MSFCPCRDNLDQSPISYDEALDRVFQIADTIPARRARSSGSLCESTACDNATAGYPLLDSVGKKSLQTLHAPHSTPPNDTSAMDGFAVNASATVSASPESPVRLRVTGSIAAGDVPRLRSVSEDLSVASNSTCVEIMTGACFPELTMPHLSSVVKVEDVTIVEPTPESAFCRYIELRRPVKQFQHRRPAGSDFRHGEIIVRRGTIIEPKHVAALASLGYTRIKVTTNVCEKPSKRNCASSCPSLRVGVLSTGSEIVDQLDMKRHGADGRSKQQIPDSNGPYLVSNLRALCPWITIEYLGVASDNAEELKEVLQKVVFEDGFDVVMSTGGVSKGRYDLVKHVVQSMPHGRIVFHGVKIRPGAPVLFASFDWSQKVDSIFAPRRSVLFGAPGNPLAAAMALRFFVAPYVSRISSPDPTKRHERFLHARVSIVNTCITQKGGNKDVTDLKCLRAKPEDKTVFWLARHPESSTDHVEIVEDQASYKLRGLLKADCWIIAPAGLSKVAPGDQLVATSL